MAETMREKLRRALFSTVLLDETPDQHLAPVVEQAVDAVLDALREPTEGMIEAGEGLAVEHFVAAGQYEREFWRRMITAAKEDR